MTTNRLRARWLASRPALGGWCAVPDSFTAELVASIGFDYVCVDMQHGLADFGDLVPMLQAITAQGTTPVVRVPFHDDATAQRALDAGAEALIFPLVTSADDAAHAASMCRYPPAGARSYGPVRARLHLGADPAAVNAEVACIVMIETRAAINALGEILAVEGVDAVYIGPNDLALALGLPLASEPLIGGAVTSVLETCLERGIPAGIHAPSGAAARRYLDAGFAFASIANDALILAAAYRAELMAARVEDPSR